MQNVKCKIFFLLGVLLISCQREGLPRGESLIVGIPQDAVLLDPRLATDAQGMKISELIFDGLFKKNEKLDLVPNLAQSFSQPDAKTYRIVLRQGVRFHDGTGLTPKDVIYTLESWRDPAFNSPFRSLAERIVQISTEGEDTIIIQLSEPFAPFLTALTKGIVPAHLGSARDFGEHPVGTGPYRFGGWRRESNMLLKANGDYFGAKPKIPNLVFHVVKDDNTRVLKLLAGELDLVQNAVPVLLLDKVKMKGDLKVASEPGIIVAYLGANLKDPILRNVEERQG